MYRFSFDLGTNSLGWAVYRLNAGLQLSSLEALGVRIFPNGRDPKSKESNAAGRRGPRGARRRHDRMIGRRNRLLKELIEFGLLPEDVEARRVVFSANPHQARARAAYEQVQQEQLGRALWHISKHRGFKSNRRIQKDADEKSKITTASDALKEQLEAGGHKTYGAFLYDRLRQGQETRIRPTGDGAKLSYKFYPTRALLEAEFDHIWRTQAPFHPSLTDAMRERLRDTIFYQRDLRPVRPGRCTFFPDRDRLPRWHQAAQNFLILSQLNNLRIIDANGERQLDLTARDLVARALMSGTKMSWAALRRTLKLPAQAEFNLEKGGLKELARNDVAAWLLGSVKKPGPLSNLWPTLDEAMREEILSKIAYAEKPEELISWLMDRHNLSRDLAEKIEQTPLPDGHLRFCLEATRAIVEEFRAAVITYNEAVSRAPLLGGSGLNHSDFQAVDGVDILPEYNRLAVLQRRIGNGTGNPHDPDLVRYGRITNPTVHIALGQFRRVMNALISKYGKPAQVVIESSRDMAKSAEELNRIEADIRKNTARNDRWRAELQEAGVLLEGTRVGDRFLRMRLWEEMGKDKGNRLCPYTGDPIALHQLHSDEIEIDHILPFEDTFDDSPANKILCFRAANRIKGKRAPGDAWNSEDLAAIITRTKHLPANKSWRFLPGALQKWEKARGFEDRQLVATSYLATIVREYAEALFPKADDEGKKRKKVWVLPGRMTAMLRQRWGLNLGDHNRKSRDDHRHHAIDAAIVGVIDERMIQQLQAHARKMGVERLDRVLPAPPEPIAGFRETVLKAVEKVNVSHRAQHGSANPSDPSHTSGKLHEDTVYGLVRDIPENQADRTIGNVVVRKAVIGLTEKEIGQVRDVKLRLSLEEATRDARSRSLPAEERKKLLPEALAEWSKRNGHRKLRILKPEANVRPVYDHAGRPYKWLVPGQNAYMDILEGPDGRWFHHTTDIWAANSGGAEPWSAVHPAAHFIMRLHKNDTLQLFDWDDKNKCLMTGSNTIKRVIGLQPSNNRIQLAGIVEAGKLEERAHDSADPFQWDRASIGKLKLRRARRVRIDELGRVHTGPHGTI